MSGAGRVRRPRLGPAERARLWLRYQRYGLLLVGVSAAAVVAAVRLGPWWLVPVVGLAALAPFGFGVQVLGRWPHKLRATEVALARLGAGRFRDRSVRAYCGDPCFRLVADRDLGGASPVPA